jgi:DNA-binding protein HU-beta
MTKSEMVDAIAKKAGITKKGAAAAIEALIGAITADLKKGNNVVITGFGTFRVSKRAARTGVNRRKPGEKIKIPARKVAAFKAGKALKEAVRQAIP